MNLARRRLAGLAAIGAIVLVAGCGGGSDDDASATTAATTAATVASAPSASDTAVATVSAPSTVADTARTDTGPSSGGAVEPSQYLSDVQSAAGALSSFGTLLQSVSSPDDLKNKAPQARTRLDEFDAAIAKLGTYTLDDARLERQRSGLARTGPRVSDTLRRFTDAAEKGDLAEIQRLVPEIQSAIGDFQAAATDVG